MYCIFFPPYKAEENLDMLTLEDCRPTYEGKLFDEFHIYKLRRRKYDVKIFFVYKWVFCLDLSMCFSSF